jgi:hypothetical protein
VITAADPFFFTAVGSIRYVRRHCGWRAGGDHADAGLVASVASMSPNAAVVTL